MEQRPFAGGWPFAPAPRGTRMSRQERARREQALARAPLFANLPARDVRSLAEVTSVNAYPEGKEVVKEGTPGTTFHVILDGQAKALHGRRTMARFSAGDFFGEIAMLDGGPRTATVVAETPLVCLTLSRGDFLDVLEDHAKLAAHILRVMAGRLRRTDQSISG
jgi:CRP-like cAMP-binding protein